MPHLARVYQLILTGLLLAVVAVPGQAADSPDLAQVRKAIEAGNAKFGEAVRAGNAAAIAALYADDAVLMPPNSGMIKGRAGLEAFWKGGLEMGIKEAVLTAVEVLGMGDMAGEIGEYKLKIQPAGKEAVEDSGKYVVIWKKQADGSWKLQVDIWNSNLPAPK